MNLSKEQCRLELMLHLRDALMLEFPELDYNVFCFGSFLTSDYEDGKSDIDLGIYCMDKMKQIAVEDSIDAFLKKEVPVLQRHILPVETAARRWLNVNILAGVQFTDYFPKELKTYLYKLRHDFRFHNERMEHRRFVIEHNEHLSVKNRVEKLFLCKKASGS